ncbi:MAG: gamma carbonic anhydrase family protein [Pseudomonadota bacterium]|nr:gamma carbonic anhydrase family protein [Pseudomonadota bacterium]
MNRPFKNKIPTIDQNCYCDDTSLIIGDCKIGSESSIWPYVVLRADVQAITIGKQTNIQDGTIIHCASQALTPPNGIPCIVGNRVTIGHQVMLHACHVMDDCLIGMGSIVMDGSIIQPNVILGARSLVTENQTLESGFLYLGSPAKKIRALTEAEETHIHTSAMHYCELAKASYT